jgi:hypothetical protein
MNVLKNYNLLKPQMNQSSNLINLFPLSSFSQVRMGDSHLNVSYLAPLPRERGWGEVKIKKADWRMDYKKEYLG